jgi:hypothetical protein
VKKNTPNPSEEVYICMFCGRAGHLDEFYFRYKRMKKMRFDYARNSYRDESIDFPPCTSSRASPHLFHGPNHLSYSFGLREIDFVSRHFGYDLILIVVIVPRIGTVFLLQGLTLALSRGTWTLYVFPVVVHVPLTQMMRCKRL